MREIRLYAHRGAAIELPENTMPAFARAVELGVDALEMDAHLSRDGHVVISHDPSGRRMCGVDASITDCDLAEIKRWDASSTFHGAPVGKTEIPTLVEVLAAFPDIIINIDLKQKGRAMAEAALAVLRCHRAQERVIIASFHAATLLAVRRAGYEGQTALPRAELLAFVSLPSFAYRRLPWRGDAAQLPVRVGPFRFGTRRVIDKCHRSGLRADFWTVNDPDQATELLALGADGIMTDDPAAMIGVFERARASAPSR